MGYVAGYDYLCYFKIMSLNKRKIKTLKELEDFLHKSNVVFPLLSEWKTKFKPKIRKVDDRTKWAIFRFQMYISIRFLEFFKQIVDLIKDEDVSKPSFSVTKVRGKLLMITKYIKKNKVFTKTVKITPRTKTIDFILSVDLYWESKFDLFKKPTINEMKKDKKFEKREYERSIINHLKKKSKYNNKNFFLNCFKKGNFEDIAKIAIKSPKFWPDWQKIL